MGLKERSRAFLDRTKSIRWGAVRTAPQVTWNATRQAGVVSYQEIQALFGKGPRASSENAGKRVLRWLSMAGNAYARLAEATSRDSTGIAPAALALATLFVLTVIFWIPLSLPARMINVFVGQVGLSSCSSGAAFGVCSTIVSIFSIAGPVIVMALMFVFRFSIKRALQRLFKHLPREVAFLAAPVIATVIFTMGWAGVTFHFFSRPGIVRDGFFPIVVGMMTYGIVRYGPNLQRWLSGYFDKRDQIKVRWRLLTTFAVPTVVAMAVSAGPLSVAPPIRDQLVVIVAIAGGWLLMAPRSGDLASVLEREPAETKVERA